MKTLYLTTIAVLLAGGVLAQGNNPPTIKARAHQQHTMMLLAKLDLGEGNISLNETDIVFAFIDGECRGTAMPMPEHDGKIFLSIGHDNDNAADVSLMAWVSDKEELVKIKQTFIFQPLKAAGEVNNPVILSLDQPVGITDHTEDPWHIGKAYPNPFGHYTAIPYTIPQAATIEVKLYSHTGQLLRTMKENRPDAGRHMLKIYKENLPDGLYLLVADIMTGDRLVRRTQQVVVK